MSLYKVALKSSEDLDINEKVLSVDSDLKAALSKIRFHTDMLGTAVRVHGLTRAQIFQIRNEEFRSPVYAVAQRLTVSKQEPKLRLKLGMWSWYQKNRNRGLVRPRLVRLYNELSYNSKSHLVDVR